MNPIILYPKTAAQVKLLRKTAEEQGMETACISSKLLEDIEDILFAERMVAAETGRVGTYDELKAKFKQLISENEK